MEHTNSVNVGGRIYGIDLIRTVAICCVILCHITESVYPLQSQEFFSYYTTSQICAFVLFSIGRIGVPLFLMITGYLLLDMEYDIKKCKKFWCNNCLHLLICTEIWWIIYDIFLYIVNHNFSWEQLMKEILFIKKVDMPQVWYMPVILGLYILIPFVANSLNVFSKKIILIPLAIYFVYFFILGFIPQIEGILGVSADVQLQVSTGFSGGIYGMYIILGYLLKKGILKNIKTSFLVMGAAFSFFLVILLQMVQYKHCLMYNLWYDCPLLLICALFIFEILSRAKCGDTLLFYWIGKYSFAIYLVHYIILVIIQRMGIELSSIGHVGNIFLKCGIVAFISLLISFIIGKSSKIGKYVLYLK